MSECFWGGIHIHVYIYIHIYIYVFIIVINIYIIIITIISILFSLLLLLFCFHYYCYLYYCFHYCYYWKLFLLLFYIFIYTHIIHIYIYMYIYIHIYIYIYCTFQILKLEDPFVSLRIGPGPKPIQFPPLSCGGWTTEYQRESWPITISDMNHRHGKFSIPHVHTIYTYVQKCQRRISSKKRSPDPMPRDTAHFQLWFVCVCVGFPDLPGIMNAGLTLDELCAPKHQTYALSSNLLRCLCSFDWWIFSNTAELAHWHFLDDLYSSPRCIAVEVKGFPVPSIT